MALQHFINHISLVVDRSGSMRGKPVVEVFDKELEYLKQRSIDLDQETRISIYLFDDYIECLTFDMDVMRFKSLKGYWFVRGSTALIDAVIQSTEDNSKLPELYGDHAFLQYVITDGYENASKKRADTLRNLLGGLSDNWTTACLVPDERSAQSAEKYGFNGGSIALWDTSKATGFQELGTQFSHVVDTYMNMRAQGIRGTQNLFTLDSSNLKTEKLKPVDTGIWEIFPVERDDAIRPYVEAITGRKYKIGSAYYQPTTPVKVQDYKNIFVQNIKDGKVYTGNGIRGLLGLPGGTVNVTPGKHKDWRIFVQSTSVNRKLFKGTNILVVK